MIIKFGTDELDTDTLVTAEDVVNYARTIKGQKVSILAKNREQSTGLDEILFDTCTENEIALRNLAYVLQTSYHTKRKELFPASVGNLILMAKQGGNASIVTPPAIDTEEFYQMQKLAYLKGFFEQYVMFLIQSRIGFGLSLSVNNAGQIYCLKDLRELHSKAV